MRKILSGLLIAFLFAQSVDALQYVTHRRAHHAAVDNSMQIGVTTTTSSESFTLPCLNTGTYDAQIDWGDGSPISDITTYNDADLVHTYATAGSYTVSITGTLPQIYFNNSGDKGKITSIKFADVGLASLANAFAGATNNTSVTGVLNAGITNFSNAWYNNSLTSFPALDLSSGIYFQYAWYNNSLTAFPATIDLSNGTNFSHAWRGNSLTSFPSLNLGSGENFASSWEGNNLASFPDTIDLSSGTDFQYAWYNNYSLTSFPALNLSSGINFASAWRGDSLAAFPDSIDLSSGEDFSNTWRGNQLTAFPSIDLSSGTNFSGAWYGGHIVSFPANMFDSSTATNYTDAFYGNALNQTSVDNILVSIDTSGTTNGTLGLNGGTNSTPSATGLAAKSSLEGKGWTVTTN